MDGLIGSSDDLGLINTAFNSYRDHLDYGKSYDDVQWVAIAYIQAGNGDLARKYYDIASEGLDASYCGGGGKRFFCVSVCASRVGILNGEGCL